MYVLFLLCLNILPSFEIPQKEQFDLTLMYRRSGETHRSYKAVRDGDTLVYFPRGLNPYFRVYSFHKINAEWKLQNVTVESFENGKLIETSNAYISRDRWQFVDTYVNAKEDLVKVTIEYSTPKKLKNLYQFFIVHNKP